MYSQPFRAAPVDGILYLTLDTPGCDVNIFSRQAATQLLGVLEGATPPRVRAVVFKSGKPGSFINGVGLMLAAAVQSPEAGMLLTAEIRAAYRAVRGLPVPAVAAIRGNCYGCGVEFILHCDYRLASDTYDTHFYMTEIADYLMIPGFGSTQDLPHLVGLANATNFLLWGERWSAREALNRGLIDACFDDASFDREVDRFVAAMVRHEVSQPQPRHRDAAHRDPSAEDHDQRTWDRIRALPPDYQNVYHRCYELMVHAAQKSRLEDADYEKEAVGAGCSVTMPVAKAALSFFFARQLTQQVCLRGFQVPRTWSVRIGDAGGALAAFRVDLVARRLHGVTITSGDPEDEASPPAPSQQRLRFREPGEDAPSRSGGESWIGTEFGLATRPVYGDCDAVMYAPLLDAGVPFVEIAAPAQPSEHAQTLFAFLTRAGYSAVLSRPDSGFVLNALIGAYLAPLAIYLARGGLVRDVNFTLRDFGFVRRPARLVAALPADRLGSLVRMYLPDGGQGVDGSQDLEHLVSGEFNGGRVDGVLLDAVLASLLAWAMRCLDDGLLSHPALVDLMAREVLDFPVGRGSLCRSFTVSSVKGMLGREAMFAHLVDGRALEQATVFVQGRRSFYA